MIPVREEGHEGTEDNEEMKRGEDNKEIDQEEDKEEIVVLRMEELLEKVAQGDAKSAIAR